ncbi:serine/threonine protein kinase [Saccharopolyspora sp. K220]|nr:serine/threonine protein kinase [Saccharopolyspora soli]
MDELLHRSVALKQLTVSDPVSEKCRKAALVRALGEARAAARVKHDGVIRIYDLVMENGHPWIVMELLSGRTLAEAIQADGPLPVEQVARVGLSLLKALRATHRAGIVHCDVKPGNVYLCDGGRVVLTDFGIACAAADGADCPHMFAGSPAYASPEQLHKDPARPASDLYSLGATLFAAVEGRTPFNKDDLVATITDMTEDEHEPAPLLPAGPLRPVIEGLLAKQPHQRLTADQAEAALRRSPT